ncbi:phosphonate transport system permease protein [Alkalispirochaeta americana]|uniref:Phosphonate transport system permease protein n=1 Tax=Alkalispirochaeta americana TaxID=159291 RepID=A0A1N6XTX4_9SPIO|nr:phosphonate ABC transporter, permease protein PhnE [Alkalispirochaeta americana]SIR05764.1 phosphonate transport system permease protein [Alkalispirochaeta americana]
MPLIETSPHKQWVYKDAGQSLKRYLYWLAGALIFLISFKYISEETMWPFVLDAPAQMIDFISRMFPPDTRYMRRVLPALWDTINIAIFGTLVAALISVPLSVLSAKNTTPHPVVRLIAVTLIVTSRSVTSLIWALLLVQIVGPGLFAGMLAIAIRGVGMISKIFYETIEEINVEPIEAIKATGASTAQVFLYGYIPQLLPAFVGVTVYRWEINIRESTIIGIVGGGGIGFLLNSAINRLSWDQVSLVLFVILATVFVAEWISIKARSLVA